MELDYKALGMRIRTARNRAELTQEELAEKASLSVTHLSNIETGSTRVSLTALVTLANALQVGMDDLLSDSVVHARAQVEADFAAILSDCDDYEIRMLRDMASALKDTLRRDQRLREASFD